MSGQRYIQEETIQVMALEDKIGVTFFDGKTPTRVSRIRYDSCFIGQLLAGDVVLSVDGQPIKSGDEFNAYCCRGDLPRKVNIKFRRDNYYKMITIKRTELKTKKGETQGIYIQARWRPDLPLGMIDDSVVVVHVEPGSAAYQHFQFGDVIEKVNDVAVKNTDAAKLAIRDSIQNKRSVVLKIIRSVRKKSQTEAPHDVRFIMRRHYGFWNREHSNTSCEDDPTGSHTESGEEDGRNATGSSSGQRANARPNVYHAENVETQQMRADEYGKTLVATPPRAGGARSENGDGTSSTSGKGV